MQEEVTQLCTEKMGLKIPQFYQVYESIRLLIDSYQKKNLVTSTTTATVNQKPSV